MWKSYFFPQVIVKTGSAYNRDIQVIESFGRKQLFVNGIQQTGQYVTGLFRRGLRALSLWHRGPMDSVLVLGVGGGGIFSQIRRYFPRANLTGVDIDAVILMLASSYFGLSHISHLELVNLDARKYLASRRGETSHFDCVVIDLYIGNDVPEFVTKQPFIDAVRKVLRPDGSLMINYFHALHQPRESERFGRLLHKIFQEVRVMPNKRNIFFFCR